MTFRRLLLVPAAVVTAVLAPAVAAAATTATATVPAADPAPAEGPAAVSTIQGVTPSVLTPEDESITLTGTVHNTGDVTLHNVQALPRFSRVPLDSRTDVRRVSADPEVNPGQRYADVHDVVDESLEPGEVGTFSLEISTDLLSFDQTGVYTVGTDIRATPDDGERLDVATSRTVVPWLSSTADLPTVPVGVLWPLAARPTMMPDGTLLDDSLAAEIGPEESLNGLVEAGAGAPVTWAVDPDLLDTVNVMAEGYEVASPSGPVDGSRADSDAAREWRESLSQATGESDLWVLPYAMPDVAALAGSDPGLATELTAQATAAADQAARALGGGTSGVAWLDAASVTDEVLGSLAAAGTETVVVPGNAVAESGALGEFRVDDAAMRVVATDLGLSDALTDAGAIDDPQAAAVDLRQRWLAETAMVAMAAAAEDVEPSLLVAAPPVRWRPDPAVALSVIETWTTIPWVETFDVSQLDQTGERESFTPDPAEDANLLPAANVDATAALHEDAAHYASLLADDDGVTDALTLATLRSASTGWRDDPVAGAAYAAAITDDLDAQFSRITVTVPESVTLSSRTGSFPLTITNELSEPVNVTLDIHSTNVDRLRVEEVEPTLVQPGERQQVTVTAEAAANGRVPIAVRLTTADGTPIGPAQPTIVNATDYGTIGWIIVGAAGALFAAAIVRRTLRKGHRDDDDAVDDDPADRPVPPDEPPRGSSHDPSPAQEVTR
ncbi:DUF6049 family protein [Jiangella asiatica]|uniref:DUF6049 family protein n=1 Tax=Jiangella asiatica TaxID=2530372 RepID=UPI0013A5CDE8|nr:DUF6049 family protein [Jiangella asiatica]